MKKFATFVVCLTKLITHPIFVNEVCDGLLFKYMKCIIRLHLYIKTHLKMLS